MERVFYDLHHRCATLALRHTSHRTRSLLENTALVGAVCAFCVVLVSHRTFVYRGGDGGGAGGAGRSIPSVCLRSVPGFQVQGEEADVIHVLIGEDPGNPSYSYTASGGEVCPVQNDGRDRSCAVPSSVADPSDIMEWRRDISSDESLVLYSYSITKGFLLLPPDVRSRHNITSRYVFVSPSDSNCFGEPFLRGLVFRVVGPDTVAVNWLLALNEGRGYLYNPRAGDLIDLQRYASEYYFLLPRSGIGGAGGGSGREVGDRAGAGASTGVLDTEGNGRWASRRRFLIFKAGVLLTSLFIFFVITNLVAFTLRETQDRMLAFTFQLRDHVRSGAPIGQLIFSHVVENLVFVPIMVGMIFFLIEFYGGDKFLAFMTLSVVWVCEVFSVISMRSAQGMQFFPRVFFLYFTLFHVYFFSCPFGFSYTSLFSTGLFLLHGMLFFLNRFELPAVLNGTVTPSSPRAALREVRGGGNDRGGADSPHTPSVNSVVGDSQQIGNHSQSPEHQGQVAATAEAGTSLGGPNNESLPSFPSMSSLRRGQQNADDDDDSSFLFFMDGEVVVHREDQRPNSQESSLSSRGVADSSNPSESESTPETPQAVSPSNSIENQIDSAASTSQSLNSRRILPLTPRHSNVSRKNDLEGDSNNSTGPSMPHLGSGPSSALSCFDWNGPSPGPDHEGQNHSSCT